ncbi:hypothetical protein R84B8_00406 [Treponema sp. R8-4-B8]
MNSLDRSLIEKAGYDNGFEIIPKSDSSVVSLCSSLHSVNVDITDCKVDVSRYGTGTIGKTANWAGCI